MSIRRAAAAAADLPQRAVHLRIVPRPANLSESREVFRLLQRFGELNTYYSLKYQYHNPADNVSLAIYRSADAAQQALNASPLVFSLERETHLSDDPGSLDTVAADPDANLPRATSVDVGEMTSPSELLHRTATTTSPPSSSSSATATATSIAPLPFTPSPAVPTAKKWFQVTLDRSRVVHADFIERQPLYKQFNPMKSMAQLDLDKQVPHKGLSDLGRRGPGAHRTPLRQLRSMAAYAEKGLPSLRAISEGRERTDMREERGEGKSRRV
ncbi:hypothetical protein G6514_010296 [Epicoccum nigrum]|nr:hypothetical protein G6514_010296 [Epicoccum nigrum]